MNIFIAPIYLPDHLYPTNVSGKTKIIYIILGKTGKNIDIKSERKGKKEREKIERKKKIIHLIGLYGVLTLSRGEWGCLRSATMVFITFTRAIAKKNIYIT